MKSSTPLNLVLVTGGRVALLALTFVGSALVIRTLGPAQFGVYALCIAYIKIVTGCFGDAVDLAVLKDVPLHLKHQSSRATEIIRGAFWLRSSVGVAGLVLAGIFAAFAASPALAMLTAAGLLGDLLLRSATGYFQAAERFKAYLLMDALVQLGRFGAVVALLLAGSMTTTTVLASYIIWPFLAFAVSLAILPRELMRLASPHWHDIVEILHYSKYMVVGLALAAIFERTDIMLLERIKGTEAVGIFSAALTLAVLPDIVSGCVSTVLYPKVTAKLASGEFLSLNRRYVIFAAPIAAIGAITALTLGTWAIETFFSNKYIQSIPVFRILVVASLMWGVITPLPSAILAFKAPRRIVAVSGLSLALVAILGLVLIPQYGVVGAAAAVFITRLIAAAAIVELARPLWRARPQAAGTQTPESWSAPPALATVVS